MAVTALALGEPPESMPIWARLQLGALGIPFYRVTHFVRSSDGRTVAAAVRGKPVYLVKPAAPRPTTLFPEPTLRQIAREDREYFNDLYDRDVEAA